MKQIQTHTRLDRDEFVPFAPEGVGTTKAYHCKQGRNNDRLYVTRTENGTILAYCHHCGASGYHSILGSRTLSGRTQAQHSQEEDTGLDISSTGIRGSDKRGSSLSPFGERDEVRERTISDIVIRLGTSKGDDEQAFLKWHPDAKRWWLEHGLTIPDLRKHGVHYDHGTGEVVLPIWNQGKVVGTTCKGFRPGAPKYSTTGNTIHSIIASSNCMFSDQLLIVEDLRSAYKCSKLIDTLPLLGTSMKEGHLLDIMKLNYQKVHIYLDNDNLLVKKQAKVIKSRLSPYTTCVIITERADPKTCSGPKLVELLTP